MWHEARRQERKIRGLIVDYRKRAERRQDFYEKIQADPTQFIQVHGRRCKIHLDPAIAAAGDGSCVIVPWQGQQDNLIDRFDVRAHLDFIPAVVTTKGESDAGEPSQEERQCNYERYRILAQNDFLNASEEKFLHQLYLEEQYGANAQLEAERNLGKKKPVKSGATIGYSYDDGDSSVGPQPFSHLMHVAATPPPPPPPAAKSDKGSESESDSDIDMDVSIEISKLDTMQAHELNACGRNYGMVSNDFYSYLTKDADEADALRIAREEEHEKMLLSGRKSRRERRAQKERRIACRPFSPPSYAAKEDPEQKNEEDTDSRSPSPAETNAGKITYITSFGGEDELQPHSKISINIAKGPQTLGESCAGASAARAAIGHPTYAQKVKENLEKLKELNQTTSTKTRRASRSPSRSSSRSGSRSRSRNRGGRCGGRRGRYRRTFSRSRSRSRSYGRRRKERSSRSSSYQHRSRRPNRHHKRSLSKTRSRLRLRSRSTSRATRRRRYSSTSSDSTSRSSLSDSSFSRHRSPHKTPVRRHSHSRSTKRSASNSSSSTVSAKRVGATRGTDIVAAATAVPPVVTPVMISYPLSTRLLGVAAAATNSSTATIATATPQAEAIVAKGAIVVEPPPPPLKRYYGRKRGGDSSNSESELESDGEDKECGRPPLTLLDANDSDDRMDVDTTSERSNPLPTMTSGTTGKQTGKYATAQAKNPSYSNASENTKDSSVAVVVSSSGSSRLNLRERLKRKMQNLLNKQYKADKRAEIEKTERERQLQQEREDEMRELALKLRRRQRELRHKYGTPSSGKGSESLETSDLEQLQSESLKKRSRSPRSSEERMRRSRERKLHRQAPQHHYHEHQHQQQRFKRSPSREHRYQRRSRSRSRKRSMSRNRRRRSVSQRRQGQSRSRKERDRQRDRERERQRDRDSERFRTRDRDRNRERHTEKESERQRGREYSERDRGREGKAGERCRHNDAAEAAPTSSRATGKNRVVISAPPKLKKLVDY